MFLFLFSLHHGDDLLVSRRVPPKITYEFSEEEYLVERIISKRQKPTIAYLVSWKNFSKFDSTWEPVLPREVIEKFYIPTEITEERLITTADKISIAIWNSLNNNCNSFDVELDLDIFRYAFGETGCKRIENCQDLSSKLPLPQDWFFVLRHHDQGRMVKFPMELKPKLTLTRFKKTVDKNKNIVDKKRCPIEKWSVKMLIKPCSVQDIDI